MSQSEGEKSERGVAHTIRQITAVVVALTALIGAVVTLVAASKNGLDQIRPTIAHWFSVKAAEEKVRPCDPESEAQQAALAGLESDDSQTRRAARKDLAKALKADQAMCPKRTDDLIAGLEHGSYRRQVGVAKALGQMEGGWRAVDQPGSIGALRRLGSKSSDATLNDALDQAVKAGAEKAPAP